MTYMKLHNAIKKVGYPKGTYRMWEGGYSFAERDYNKKHGIVSFPPGIVSFACILVRDLHDLNKKLQAIGINSFIYNPPHGYAAQCYKVGLFPPSSHVRVGLTKHAG